MPQKEVRYYKGLYKITIDKISDWRALVTAEEPIPLTSSATIQRGEQFLTVTRLLHKEKKET